MTFTNKKLRIFLACAFLFLINFVFRLLLISKGPYHGDCLLLAVNAELTLQTFQIHYLQGLGLPLTTIMAAIFVGLAKLLAIQDIVTAVNLMSVTLGALCVPVFFLLVRTMFDCAKIALIAAGVLSINPMFLSLSVFGNSQMPSLLTFLVCLYFLFDYLRTDKKILFYLSALSAGLMGAARLQDLVSMAIILAFIIFIRPNAKPKNNKLISLVQYFGIAALTVLIFYIPYMLDQSHFASKEVHLLSLFKMVFKLDKISYERFMVIWKWMLLTISGIGRLGILGGFIFLFRKNIKIFMALVGLIFLPTVFYGCFWYIVPRVYLLSTVISIIPLAYFFGTFMQQKRMIQYPVLFVLFASLLINFGVIMKTVKFRHDYALLPDFYKWIAEVTEAEAYIIERDHSLFIKYYGQRLPLGPPVSLFSVNPEELVAYKQSIDSLLEENKAVYITRSALYGYPKEFGFKQFMLQNFELEHVGDKMIEDWYNGVLRHSLVKNALYKIKAK